MNYTIAGFINRELVLESTINAKNSNIAFQTLKGIIETIEEEAYEDQNPWAVTIYASCLHRFGVVHEDAFELVNVNYKTHEGLAHWDELLSHWV